MAGKRRTEAAARPCQRLGADLSAYFDGELDSAGRSAVQAHLEGCEYCRHQLEGMRKIQQALSGLVAPGTPRRGSVLEQLRAKLRAQEGEDMPLGPAS